MSRSNKELWYALVAVVVITTVYVWVTADLRAVPPASELFGHSLGVLGFLLMLMTETLYSLRKRSRQARWGRTADWLRFHIFTGLVGPYLVLLHTSWKFQSLAGVVTLLMIVVVLSGVLGRYIYTAVPRTADGVALDAAELEQQIDTVEQELARWLADRPEEEPLARMARLSYGMDDLPEDGILLVLGRALPDLGYRLAWWRRQRELDPATRGQVRNLNRLLRQRRLLRRQVASLAMARRLLSVWHSIHIPIGLALFTAAFIHIGAAIYFATLLK